MFNTNDCSAAWQVKCASCWPGKNRPAVLSTTSARAEKRFELFTGNSVEPFVARRAKADATGATGDCASALNHAVQLNLLSGLMFLDSRKQQAMACGLRHVETRAT